MKIPTINIFSCPYTYFTSLMFSYEVYDCILCILLFSILISIMGRGRTETPRREISKRKLCFCSDRIGRITMLEMRWYYFYFLANFIICRGKRNNKQKCRKCIRKQNNFIHVVSHNECMYINHLSMVRSIRISFSCVWLCMCARTFFAHEILRLFPR